MPERSGGGDVGALRALVTSLRTAELPTWLRDVTDPEQVAQSLRGRIGALVPDAHDLLDLRLQDVRARRSWSLRFIAEVATSQGSREVVLMAERPPSGSPPSPQPGLILPELALRVRAVDGDPGLPTLPILTDPVAARPLLESALRDGGRPGLHLEDAHPRLVRYKPGHRATLVYDLVYSADAAPSWPRKIVAKTYRDEGGATTYAWMTDLWANGPGGAGSVRLAEPIGYVASHRTLLQGALPGDRTLADLIVSPSTTDELSVAAAIGEAADGLVALHRSSVSTGPPRTTAAELTTTRRLLDRLGPSLQEHIRNDAAALLRALAGRADQGHEETVPVHGAFRPAQVLFDGARPGFLDFDGFGQGERSVDAGRFLARLAELLTGGSIGADHDRGRRAELTHAFLDRYRAGAPLAADRTALWVWLDLATGAIRSWYRARPERATLLFDLLDDALDADW